MSSSGQQIAWLTCYEYSFASALNTTELDMILVGDSGGMVSLGYKDTVPVSMDEMILLSSAVRRGAPDKFIVGDMPKGSYEASDYDAVNNAMRFVKESGCDAIKLEGGSNMAARAKAIVESGISVIGHIGLTPQTSSTFGGYRVVGRDSKELEEMQTAIRDLESAGAFAILLEAIPPLATKKLLEKANSIILGIGAGQHTNGQLLILHDLLGLYPSFRPKFAKCYVPKALPKFTALINAQSDLTTFGRTTRQDGIHELTRIAVTNFVNDVRNGDFPDENFSYKD
jgi:3-methyl-2-oxobutanoate hydroxymethyltransferase